MSTSSTSSTLFTPLQFTGISQYSSDFQSILSRATSIAALPMQALQQNEASVTLQETALTTLGSSVSDMQSALQAIGKLGAGSGLSGTSTDSSIVTATNTTGTTPASYSITNVTSLASAASEVSAASYANSTSAPVSSTGNMQLTVGTKTYPVTLTANQNNLSGLASVINNLNAGATASVLTTSSGDYLSISANSTGATTLQLANVNADSSTTQFLTANNQGTNTNFKLNGIAVSEPNTTISDVIPGLTLNFTGTTTANPTESITVGSSTNKTQIANALQQLVTSFNALSNADNAQVGKSGGALAGNNIVYQIGQALTSIVQYQGGNGSVTSLAALGISIDQSGQMLFDQNTFGSLSSSAISSALQMFGSATTGLGGLQQKFSAIADPVSGSIANQENQWANTVTRLKTQISTMTDQITAMEQGLNKQLQAADAQVADLASQQNVLTASITSLNYALYGYNTSSTTTRTI